LFLAAPQHMVVKCHYLSFQKIVTKR